MIADTNGASSFSEMASGDNRSCSGGSEEEQKRLVLTGSELSALSPVARQILNEICLQIAKVRDSAEI